MVESRQETYEWYEDDIFEIPHPATQALPEIPGSWRYFGWTVATLGFSAVWMLESWTASFPVESRIGPMADAVWTLLLSLAICCCVYKFSKARSNTLAHLLCLISAIVLLLHHATTT